MDGQTPEINDAGRRILEALGEGVFVLDAQASISEVNEAAVRLLGYRRDQLIGRPFEELVAEADLLALVGVAAALGEGVEHNLNILLKDHEDDYVLVTATTSPLQLDGSAARGYVLLCRDAGTIQDMLSEENRRAAAEAERADMEARARGVAEEREQEQRELGQQRKLESIGQLAAGIAHEINTPTQFVGDNVEFAREAFTDLMAFVQRCKEALEESDTSSGPLEAIASALEEADVDYLSEELPTAFEQTLEGVRRIAEIVSAMKDFSHRDIGVRKATDLHAAVETTVTVSRNEWKTVAKVEFDFAPDMPHVPCFADELKQVLLNLIVNSAQAIADTAEDGKLGTITIGTRKCGDMAELWIADTGRGIDEAIRDQIFDPFFTTKEVGKGTGQGLAIAHSVVQKHGGEILLESEVGKGTSFRIRLPLWVDAG